MKTLDIRGLSFAIVVNDIPQTSGRVPSLASEDDETAKLPYLTALTAAYGKGAQLYLGTASDISLQHGSVIFGLTWEEIQAKQQGQPLPKRIKAVMPENSFLVFTG